MLRTADWLVVPFSLFWCGFAIFWEITVVASGAPIFFSLWGIPFVFAGLYFVLGRFVIDSRVRARTFYGVTNSRIIILKGLAGTQVKSLALRALPDLSLNERSDRRGTITFGSATPWSGLGNSWPGAASYLARQE